MDNEGNENPADKRSEAKNSTWSLEMKSQRKSVSAAVIAAFSALMAASAAQAANEWAVDAKGNITLNGAVFRIKGGSWFGLEGRHEPSSDATNPSGAPMELYLG